MPEPKDIHVPKAVTEHKGYYAAIYCTYGVDLAFFEEVILRPLRNNGCRHHIIFVDSQRYADTVTHLRGSAELVGRQYLLVPVHMPPFRSFHAKLTLLLGPGRGRLLVGSGNLTFTGFGQNAELYTCLDWTPEQSDHLLLFQTVWQFINTLQERWGFNRIVDNVLRQIQYQVSWLSQPAKNELGSLQFWHTLSASFIEQLAAHFAGQEMRSLTILTPFLDKEVKAIRDLYQELQPKSVRLVLQDKKAVGDSEMLAGLQTKGIPLTLYSFGDDARYVHAKLYLFETNKAVYALTGSPNCTAAALLAAAGKGNIETGLFRRAEAVNYFDYLLPTQLHAGNQIEPQQLTLRKERLSDSDMASLIGPVIMKSWVRLLDITVKGQSINLQIEIQSALPDTVKRLLLQFMTVPAYSVLLNMVESGVQEISLPISEELQSHLFQPISARIIGADPKGQTVDLGCPILWVINQDALQESVRWGQYSTGRATDCLAEMFAQSEEDWRDLYLEIQRLVQLDVARISHRHSSSSVKPTTSVPKPTIEKETQITLASQRTILDTNEEEELSREAFRESELSAFFDHIRTRLPGLLSLPQHRSDSTTREHFTKRSRWTPSRHTQTRFINLVRKYSASLQNPEFMGQLSVPDCLAYYIVFQRIIWLLHTHQVVDDAQYLALYLEIQRGFWGHDLLTPPVNSPGLRGHLRHSWSEDWMIAGVPYYSLAGLGLAMRLASQLTDDESYLTRLKWMAQRMLTCLRVITDWQTVLHSIEEMEAMALLQEIAYVFELEPEELALSLLPWFETDLDEITYILDGWLASIAFAPGEVVDSAQERLLYQANVDYRRAILCLQKQRGNVEGQARLLRDLVFWTKRAGALQESAQWGQHMIGLYKNQGDKRQVAEALYAQAQQSFYEGNYDLADRSVSEALSLAEQLKERPLQQQCRQLLNYMAFFVRAA